MAKQLVAIVFPEDWVKDRDKVGDPIKPPELVAALDQIQAAHPKFDVVGVFDGTVEQGSLPPCPRLLLCPSGTIALSSELLVSDRPLGDNLRVAREVLTATIERIMAEYARRH